MMNRIGRERGWPPSGEREYQALRSPRGALAAGSPEQVAEKILFEHELFGNQRYIGQMSVGAVDARRRAALDGALRHRGRAARPRRGRPPRGRARADRLTSPLARPTPPAPGDPVRARSGTLRARPSGGRGRT